ncbi:LytR family transcriptional regulator [Georgenia yuyongxinii]|uniref:LytR family transcriptional regulator n=1 Tax=Georgenia yuyongxinii TaxID=2589797 RepID=A0A5B8C693_9MICO|nr:LCP family protein [Georgenia yuyongxinii]QDC25727.1 LytR family transcriptional regulator [Georgenia yuyongxinii]
MGRDERDVPPSYSPGSSGRRPAARGARPVGPDQGPAVPRPRRQAGASQPRPDAPVRRRSVREQSARAGAGYDGQPPPSYAPANGGHARRAGARDAAEHDPTATRVDPGRTARSGTPRTAAPATAPHAPGRRRRRPLRTVLVVLLVLLIAWPVGLLVWANGKIQHTEALSGAPNTPGTTYLLAGSDSRADGAVADPTEGQRSDTIMVMHVPASGPAALISLPRDTLVEIPGGGLNKLNAAYSQGGAPLLVETVEGLTGLTMDHYVEIGMGGVRDVVDAVGGVNLCLDYDVVHDEFSGLEWVAGCHQADGTTALAFARMRYSDPQGDIGRGERQRQVIGAVVKEVAKPATLVNPVDQVQLIDAGTNALVVDTDTGIIDLGRMALAFRGATGPDGIVGAPPIASMDYRPGGGLGSTVLLDQEKAPAFFQKLRDGELTAADVETP